MTQNAVADASGDAREGRYANHFSIGHNAFEVILEFGQFYEGSERAVIHTRIVTSPAYAAGLLELLGHTVRQHEETFGPIATGRRNE
jgi:hypothetical protein